MAPGARVPALRVAFVLPSFAGGGAERVTLQLAAALHRAGIATEIVVLDGAGPLAPLVPPGAPVRDLGTPRLRRALPGLLRTLRQVRPAAVVSTLGYVSIALLASRALLPANTRLVLREANLPSLSLPNGPHPILMRHAYRSLFSRADAVLCTSERMAAEFRSAFRVPSERLHLLPNPVDESAVRQAAAAPRRVAGPGPRFIAAGRLTRQKGFDWLINMPTALPPSAHLTILGDGPDRSKLQAIATRAGLRDRVAMPGFEHKPWPWYAGADALVLPSRWEGMPNAALEALACGTRVIATPEAGGIAEVMAAAPPGAIVIAEAGEPFVAAMRAVVPSLKDRPGTSLLPAGHDLSVVASRFAAILAGLC